jgi:hypothetical protein
VSKLYALVALVAGLLAGCSGDPATTTTAGSTWTTDDYQETVEFCVSLSAEGGGDECAELVRLLRDDALCSVEEVYLIISESTAGTADEAMQMAEACA